MAKKEFTLTSNLVPTNPLSHNNGILAENVELDRVRSFILKTTTALKKYLASTQAPFGYFYVQIFSGKNTDDKMTFSIHDSTRAEQLDAVSVQISFHTSRTSAQKKIEAQEYWNNNEDSLHTIIQKQY
jgi:hypothetical protein